MFESTTRFAIVMIPYSLTKGDGYSEEITPEINVSEMCRFGAAIFNMTFTEEAFCKIKVMLTSLPVYNKVTSLIKTTSFDKFVQNLSLSLCPLRLTLASILLKNVYVCIRIILWISILLLES